MSILKNVVAEERGPLVTEHSGWSGPMEVDSECGGAHQHLWVPVSRASKSHRCWAPKVSPGDQTLRRTRLILRAASWRALQKGLERGPP